MDLGEGESEFSSKRVDWELNWTEGAESAVSRMNEGFYELKNHKKAGADHEDHAIADLNLLQFHSKHSRFFPI
jgi:hypothetical protein